jgi:hypothetical protein
MPVPDAAVVDAAGQITAVWRMFLQALWLRTGGAINAVPSNASLGAETQQRQAADAALTTAINNEVTRASSAEQTLTTSVAREAMARAQGDMGADAYAQALVAVEAAARQAADALLVPLATLCSLWAACNLNFLPTADPGHGQPWLSGNQLVVGSPLTVIGLENGTDQWLLEAGTVDQWQWG